tara:strand:- start:2662 stop:2949 length:288 start_codon:yes stop_codon:yes gene_type:complete
VLARAARAEGTGLDVASLGDAAADIELVAERLTDLGLLRVKRAGHYDITPMGREVMTVRVGEENGRRNGAVNASRKFFLAFLVVSLGLFAWLVWG